MKIKVYVGPKEKAFYEEMLKIKMGDYYQERAIVPAILEDMRISPNSLEFIDEDVDFNEERAKELLDILKEEFSFWGKK
jgi:hypothetical protein